MATSDLLFIYNLFKTYGSFKWNDDLALVEKIRIFLGSLTTHIYFPDKKKQTKKKTKQLSKFLRQSLLIFIIKVFRTIVFIFIVISTTFRPICPLVFFRCLSNSGTFTELRTMSFIETTVVACSDSVCHNRVQVLSIPVYYSPVVRIEPVIFRWLSS